VIHSLAFLFFDTSILQRITYDIYPIYVSAESTSFASNIRAVFYIPMAPNGAVKRMDITAMARMISPDAKPILSGMPPMAACFKPLFQRGLVRSRILPFGFWQPGEITSRYSYSNQSQNSTLPDLPGYFLTFTTGGRLNRFDLTRFWAPPISFVLLPGGKSSNNLWGIPFRDHFAFLYPYFYNLRYPLFAATAFSPILFLQSWYKKK